MEHTCQMVGGQKVMESNTCSEKADRAQFLLCPPLFRILLFIARRLGGMVVSAQTKKFPYWKSAM